MPLFLFVIIWNSCVLRGVWIKGLDLKNYMYLSKGGKSLTHFFILVRWHLRDWGSHQVTKLGLTPKLQCMPLRCRTTSQTIARGCISASLQSPEQPLFCGTKTSVYFWPLCCSFKHASQEETHFHIVTIYIVFLKGKIEPVLRASMEESWWPTENVLYSDRNCQNGMKIGPNLHKYTWNLWNVMSNGTLPDIFTV